MKNFIVIILIILTVLAVYFTAIEPNPVPDPKEGSSLLQTTAENKPQHTNRLNDETSPYLLQHAHNPVEWYPWGEEALARAKSENKPIFLSIGYSACHWCHVMAHESFEDEAVAEIMNRHFVNIKVDREERPDLDEIYMSAVQILTGSGGWPMSVFLTPDLKPFYGGTYYPPDDMYGRPGFKTVLTSLAKAWGEQHEEILKNAEQLTQYISQSMTRRMGEKAPLDDSALAKACQQLAESYDSHYGGFSGAPKFPSAPSIALLLRQYVRTEERRWLEMATFTLTKMAYGGMYDQLGGGFHRYSVDAQWLVPHFEKMLYDNAQLAQAYLEAYQATHDVLYRRVAQETLDYVLRDMSDAQGGFYSAEDADSEGREGKFYVWKQDEIMSLLGPDDGYIFCTYYNVRKGGNFSSHESYHEGQNILHIERPAAAVAKELSLTEAAWEQKVRDARAKLMAVREKRVRPGRDDKILASWNGLMVSAFAHGYQVLGDARYRSAAERAADFVLTRMRKEGRLQRSYRNGETRVDGYLDDYAFNLAGLIDLYEATFALRWLTAADELAGEMIKSFWDEKEGGFFFASAAHTNLIARSKPVYDGAEPSGNSMAALALLRLSKLTDNRDFFAKAEMILQRNQGNLAEAPMAYLKLLCAADFYLHPPKEIAIAGQPGSEAVKSLIQTLHEQFIPNKVMALVNPSDGNAAETEKRIPLLASKTLVDGKPAVYVCKDFACKRPVTTREDLLLVLGMPDESKRGS